MIKDVYGTMIQEILDRRGRSGATTNEIVNEIVERIDTEGGAPATPFGIRAALTRLYKRAKLAKKYVYEPTEETIGRDGRVVKGSLNGKRVYRYYMRYNAPPDAFRVEVPEGGEMAPVRKVSAAEAARQIEEQRKRTEELRRAEEERMRGKEI